MGDGAAFFLGVFCGLTIMGVAWFHAGKGYRDACAEHYNVYACEAVYLPVEREQ